MKKSIHVIGEVCMCVYVCACAHACATNVKSQKYFDSSKKIASVVTELSKNPEVMLQQR